jgi:peptide/nickel transport system ATP-binding protein
MTALLDVKDLQRHFFVEGKKEWLSSQAVLRAVDGVTLSVQRGKTLGLVGESGCGKSTMAKLVLGLISATAGTVEFDGKPVTARRNQAWRDARRHMQMVYQDPLGALDRRLTALAQVIEPLLIHDKHSELKPALIAEDMMRAVGLTDNLFKRYPHELSGGQRQRVVLARALVLKPSLLVCDEPISALDVSVQAQVINLLDDLRQQMNLTMLFISHDLRVVRHICDEVAVMYLGRIIEQGSAKDVLSHPAHPYTQALISAISTPGAKHTTAGSGRIILKGEPPNPVDVPSGCSFHPRCSLATAHCKTSVPVTTRIGDAHTVSCHLHTMIHHGATA